ncbi:MAG TPA: gamma-glutamyltransferase [Terriglobia bacterium]|nr:gamma-glutamyltransferase [Terriglobia bacterium]
MKTASLALAVFSLYAWGTLPATALTPVAARHGLVVSSEENASEAGVETMKAGGNAVDAAVAVGFALAVTHPWAGNIGGGGFMLIRMASGEAAFVDYREEAPGKAVRNMYLNAQGNLVPEASIVGALAVGVPGTVAGLALAEQKYGKLGLAHVLEPAIRLAEQGFPVSFNLAESLKESKGLLEKFTDSRRIFLRDGKPYEPGEILKQPELAETLKRIAAQGPDGFYKGPVARAMVATMERYHGLITADDLAGYEARLRPPIVGHFRGYTIVSAPPPSSGGIALLEMLNILEPLDLGSADSYPSMHLMVESMRRAYADRAAYLGDSDFVKVPVAGLTNPEYAAKLRQEILETKPDAPVAAGKPAGWEEEASTTHYSVVDADGDAVSNTYTLNGGYGSGVTAEGAGFLLNNEMDDFASKPGSPNMFGLVQGEANAIAPHKRPLSSMTPTIVLQSETRNSKFETRPALEAQSSPASSFQFRVSSFESQSAIGNSSPPGPGSKETVRLVLGSPGGGTIINTVLEVLLDVLAFKMDVREAVTLPRFHDQWMPDKLILENWGFSSDTVDKLKEAGYQVLVRGHLGECQAIEIDPRTGWRFGAADPRGDGRAVGY